MRGFIAQRPLDRRVRFGVEAEKDKGVKHKPKREEC